MLHSPKGQPLQSLSQNCQDEGQPLHMADLVGWFTSLALALHHAPFMRATRPAILNFLQNPTMPSSWPGLRVSAFNVISPRKPPHPALSSN